MVFADTSLCPEAYWILGWFEILFIFLLFSVVFLLLYFHFLFLVLFLSYDVFIIDLTGLYTQY